MTRASQNVRFGSKADMCSAPADVRFVPGADYALQHQYLFDHLVGGDKETGWHRKAEGLCCFEVNGRLVLCGCLYWKVGWFFAAHNPVYIGCRPFKLVGNVSAV